MAVCVGGDDTSRQVFKGFNYRLDGSGMNRGECMQGLCALSTAAWARKSEQKGAQHRALT